MFLTNFVIPGPEVQIIVRRKKKQIEYFIAVIVKHAGGSFMVQGCFYNAALDLIDWLLKKTFDNVSAVSNKIDIFQYLLIILGKVIREVTFGKSL